MIKFFGYNYEEFLKDYEAYYHVKQVGSYDYLKSKPELSDIFNQDKTGFQKNKYTDSLYSNYLEITPPFFRIRDILMKKDLNDKTYMLIENTFKELLDQDNIFKFYFADIIKFLPKGKEKFNDIYMDRLDESKQLLEEFMTSDNNLNNIVFQKLISLYVFKQNYEKNHFYSPSYLLYSTSKCSIRKTPYQSCRKNIRNTRRRC